MKLTTRLRRYLVLWLKNDNHLIKNIRIIGNYNRVLNFNDYRNVYKPKRLEVTFSDNMLIIRYYAREKRTSKEIFKEDENYIIYNDIIYKCLLSNEVDTIILGLSLLIKELK